jgi:hypothetical protein
MSCNTSLELASVFSFLSEFFFFKFAWPYQLQTPNACTTLQMLPEEQQLGWTVLLSRSEGGLCWLVLCSVRKTYYCCCYNNSDPRSSKQQQQQQQQQQHAVQ